MVESAVLSTENAGDAVLAEHFVGGERRPARGGRLLRRSDPSGSGAVTEVTAATADEVGEAVAAAEQVTAQWRRTPPAERAAALERAAVAVRERAPELGAQLTAATGRLLGQATESATVAADLLDEAATTGLGATGRTLAGSPAALDAVRREPRGVVAVITPWNDPFPAAAGLLAAALVTGNTVVHKPSERSALPGFHMARLLAECLPPGVLNIVSGDGRTGADIVADERVALVAHVGSTGAGRAIGQVAGARGAKVLLENGGKDAIVVDNDVDARWAAQQIATGAFTNSGQICTAVERIYVHEDVADDVVEALIEAAQELVVGDPADAGSTLGPLVDEEQLATVVRHVEEAVAAGARRLTGGERLPRPGCWFPPTVLDGCPPHSGALSEETFGPVAAVQRVASFAEGLAAAGASSYGLAATVLTGSVEHALRAVAELDVGTVKVNAVFGGAPGGSADPRRDSGGGPGFGPDLLREMTVLKTVHLGAPGSS